MGLRETLRKTFNRVAPQTPAAIETGLRSQGMDNSASYGPGRPLNPYQGYSTTPRQVDYPVSVNISTRSRQSWGRTSFETLRGIIDAYDVARVCINHKIDEIRSMEPLFVAADGISGDVEDAIDAAKAALAFPDRQLPYDTWLAKWLENLLRYDAGPLYRLRDRMGRVIGLEVIDGTTIAPYVDENGRIPSPPSPAYYQLIHGIPFNWYTSDDITYHMFRPQPDSPYGLAPIESMLLTANTDIRFQWWFLQAFTEGSVPAAYGEAPPDTSNPDQLAEWQDYWDAVMEGDQSQQHKVKWIPHGAAIKPIREHTFDTAFAEALMVRTAAGFGVVPQDIGLVKDVNRANGETQTDVQFRVNTLPWVRFVEGTLTRYLQMDLGLPVKVSLDTGRDKEDRVQLANAWKIYIESGMASVDEGRQELLGLPTDNQRPIPRFIFSPRTGPVPLTSLLAIAGPTDPETAAPVDDVPLSTTPFDGAKGVLPDKTPGGTQFKRAPIDPDEPAFPELEKPVPGSDVVGTKPGAPVIGAPVAKSESAGVTSGTGITGVDLLDEDAKESELRAFKVFVKRRRREGKWRPFAFTALDPVSAHRLNTAAYARLRKDAGEISVAGLCVRAADTGRVLLLQRGLDPEDPASGLWEFPGGHIEPGEDPFAAACREWQEEVGCLLPPVQSSATWSSGPYVGHVVIVPSEAVVDMADRDAVTNPDDPDGDSVEAVAWIAVDQLAGMPLRPELAAETEAVTGCLNDVVAKAAKPAWANHPIRGVEDRLLEHHTAALSTAAREVYDDTAIQQAVAGYLRMLGA